MDAEETERLVRHCIGLWATQAGIDELATHVTPDFVHHAAIGRTLTWEQMYRSMTYLANALTDLRVEIQHLIAAGDWVAAYLTMEGTHTGDFLEIAPTGRRIRWNGTYHCRIAGGKIAEDWDVFLATPFPVQIKTLLQQPAIA